MPQFVDSLNRPWTLAINYQSVKRVRAELGVDILAVVEKDSGLLAKLANDEVLLVDIISVILTDQINQKGLSAEQFAEGMLGDGLQGAVDALIEGIADFSRPQKGAVIRKTWQALSAAQTRASARICEVAASSEVQVKIDRIVDSALATWTDSSGD